ncbi:hypothetical protein PHISP_06832 [Aspergillus sp. HF37]|nr:hypothetical protein PHISP_06832 [Aspergillus sp. HF37]
MLEEQSQQDTPKAPPRWSRSISSQAHPGGMAAGRQSMRDELSQKRDPLGLAVGPETRNPPSFSGGNGVAERTRSQRGDLNELHREAMRRMQAASIPPRETEAEHSNRRHPQAPNPRQSAGQPEANLPRSPPRRSHSLLATLSRPPSVRLANPVNYVPRITPVTVARQLAQLSDENLPLENHRDAYPLLTLPEQRRSRPTPSPTSLVVERSQGETESGRTSIALPPGQRRSGAFETHNHHNHNHNHLGMSDPACSGAMVGDNLRPPEPAHLSQDPRPRRVPSQMSLGSQAHIASVPSNTGPNASELAWGPAHPCYPHLNPHVPLGSNEFLTTRVIRVRRDWMIRGDLAPAFSNLYPEILDPLLSEQEFRKVIAYVNGELIKAFNPFSLRSWLDGAVGLLTGWFWEDLGAPAVKRHLERVEAWIDAWNREVGAKDGVRIWSLRRTAYMSLDIQIPDPKVGIVQEEGGSLPGTRPGSGAGRAF